VLGPVAARLQQAQLKQMQAGRERAFRTLAEPRYLALVDALYGLLADPPLTAEAQDPVRPVLRQATRRAVRKLRRRLDAALDARDTDPGEALHEVRKAAKQLRYTAEIGRGEVAHMKKVVRVAKRAQTVLGEHQDTVVTRELCRRHGIVAAAAGENAFTYGRLHALEQARAERTERDFWKRAPKLRAVVKAG
jgi:CHAD domain-containing protein